VLGSIESGVDFERRVLEIYQQCRTFEEIEQAFAALQAELDEKIESRLQDARQILLEHFDEDVHARLKVNLAGTQERLDRMGKMFWDLTHHVLNENARFDNKLLSFDLFVSPIPEIPTGRYHLISKNQENISGNFLYRLSHPLGERVITDGKNCETPEAEVQFDIANHPAKITVVEDLRHKSGLLHLQRLCIDSFDREEYLLFSGFTDDGMSIDQETCEKLFHCGGRIINSNVTMTGYENRMKAEANRHARATISRSLEENSRHFNEAREQLDKWAEDMEIAAGKELDDTKKLIRALNRQARLATTMQEQRELQEQIRLLEKKKRKLRQKIFDVEDEIAEKRDMLIDALEKRMKQKTEIQPLFTIRWSVN